MGWQELYRRAARQHGAVSVSCARAADIAESTLRARATRERWHAHGPGVWLLPGTTRTAAALGHAAVLAVPGGVVTGWSAAALHGLRRSTPGRVELLRATGVGDVVTSHVEARRTRSLPADDVTSVEGVPVVSIPRLCRELADRTALATLRNLVIDARLRDRRLTADLAALLLRDRRFPGRPVLRTVLDQLADDGSDSGFEHRVVERLRALGLPPDGQQIAVSTSEGRRLLDLGWTVPRVAVECLGFSFHASAAQLKRDVERQNAIAASDDWLVLGLTWEMFHRDWEAFEERLRVCLDRRTRKCAS